MKMRADWADAIAWSPSIRLRESVARMSMDASDICSDERARLHAGKSAD
jgi:hypothetical protein